MTGRQGQFQVFGSCFIVSYQTFTVNECLEFALPENERRRFSKSLKSAFKKPGFPRHYVSKIVTESKNSTRDLVSY